MPKSGSSRSQLIDALEARLLFCVEPTHDGMAAGRAALTTTIQASDLVAHARSPLATAPAAGTGIVEGHVFLDANANGKRARRDLGLFNQTVFLDADKDGKLDAGETSTTTDADGSYRLTAPAGHHVVRHLVWKKKMMSSLPVSGGREITVVDGQTLADVDFGSYLKRPQIIDIMVLYTPSARLGAGGQSEVRALIKDSIADANAIFATSRVNLALRLVHRSEVSYDDSGSLDRDLTRLANTREGFMDNVHDLRDEHDADLVSLFVDFGEDADGIAYILDNHFPDPDELGFSVIRQGEAIASEHVFAHEIGHNLGASHDRDNADTDGAFSYSFAHRFEVEGKTYRTVMAYSPGTLLPIFSNPNLSYKGVPLGVTAGDWGQADNARTLRRNASAVAGFREGDLAGNSRGRARIVGEIVPNRTETYSDFVGTADVRDVYRIRVTQPVMVRATLTELTNNANLHLIDKTGDTIAASRTKGTADEKLRTIVGAGTYYLRIPAVNNGTRYKLTIAGAELTPQQIDPRKVPKAAAAASAPTPAAASFFGERPILADDEDREPLPLEWL